MREASMVQLTELGSTRPPYYVSRFHYRQRADSEYPFLPEIGIKEVKCIKIETKIRFITDMK